MHIGDVSGAIGEGCNWVQERGTQRITDLKSGMIVTMPKTRQLDKATIDIRRSSKLLRENRMGNTDV